MTAGIKSSEFWISVLGALVGPGGILLAVQDKLEGWGLVGVIIAQIIGSAAIVWRYTASRQAVKEAAVAAPVK